MKHLTLMLLASLGAQTEPGGKASFVVQNYGAKGDGTTDDTAAIQAAIRAAEAAPGGGIVRFPKGTYLLNSTHPSPHPWFFYNLQIRSKVTLAGEPGAKLLQGPGGRHAVVDRATEMRNTVLAFGADYTAIRFQNPAANGGFYPLQATRASSSTVLLKSPVPSSKFRAGDYVAIYEVTSGDVLPTETGQVTSVDPSTGSLVLKEPLSRSFSSPSIANVTALATTDIGITDLIIEGAEPLAVTEAFGFTVEGCRFVTDTSIGEKNVINYNLNTLNGFRFSRNEFTSAGPSFAVMEMTQRNSRHGVWDGNTFDIRQGGMGEYAADIRFTKNTFRLHPDAKTTVGIMIGGQDILFSGNTVSGGNITSGGGWGCLLSDYVGPDFYAAYVGNIRIMNNVFDGQADGNACVDLLARDTSFTGNKVRMKGSALGIHAEGPLPQSLTIKDNTFAMGSGNGILVAGSKFDGSTIIGNTFSGSGTAAIYVASPSKPNEGKHFISGNTVSGYASPLFIDRRLHPGTVLNAGGNERK